MRTVAAPELCELHWELVTLSFHVNWMLRNPHPIHICENLALNTFLSLLCHWFFFFLRCTFNVHFIQQKYKIHVAYLKNNYSVNYLFFVKVTPKVFWYSNIICKLGNLEGFTWSSNPDGQLLPTRTHALICFGIVCSVKICWQVTFA